MKLKYFALYLLFFFSGEIANAQTYKIWGTAKSGGSTGDGVVFQLNRDGTGYKIMHNFTTQTGANPTALIKGPNNNLYGLTATGGQNSKGVLYSINTANNAYSVLHHFTAAEGSPASLFLASNGKIFGTATGGTPSYGRLFKFNPANNAFTTVFQFGGVSTGNSPVGRLMQASNGLLYGMTQFGGIYDAGVIYSFNTLNNVFNKLYNFYIKEGDDDGFGSPRGSLTQDGTGLLYAVGAGVSDSQLSTGSLFSFNPTNSAVGLISYFSLYTTGAIPVGTLIRTTPGNFYGLTKSGGANLIGTLYLYNTWVEYPLTQINFNGVGNGSAPVGSLMRSANSKMYGMTESGGSYGFGTIFNYSAASNLLTKIHDFTSTDGHSPTGDLVEIATGIAVAAGTTAMNPETELITTEFNLSPNPVLQGQSINIKFKSAAAARYTITLTDASGKELLIKTGASVQGLNLLKLEMGNLPKGLYIIAIQNGSFKNVSKLIVQ